MNATAQNFDLTLLDDVESVRSGDTQALARLIDRTSSMVTSIALAIVKDIDSAEDVTQQVYIKVWQQIKTLKHALSFLPWLRQTTRNTAFNFLRDNKVSRTVSGQTAEDLLSEYSDADQNQDEILLRSQQGEIISLFVDELPSEDREVILLFYREGESTKRVSQLLELSEANVRKKLSRTRAKLKEKMLAKCGDLLLATAPTIGFGSILVSSITASTPAAALTLTSASSGASTTWLGKLAMMFGGAMIGVFGAIGGVILGSKMQLKGIEDDQFKRSLISSRNRYIVFLLIFGICFTLSYELTDGWLAPFACYSLFAVSLIYFVTKGNNRVIDHRAKLSPNDASEKVKQRKQKIYSAIGLIVGLSLGFAALIAGFINSGRLIV